MPDLYRDLHRAYLRLAHRPLPRRWIAAEPSLAGLATVSASAEAIRDRHCLARADRVILALAHIARADCNAATVLLEALAPLIPARIGRLASQQFRDEVLGDLAIVILEVEDLDQVDRLAQRLTWRAHRRARRRFDRETRDHMHEYELFDTHAHPDDVAELATDRAHIHAIHQQVQRGIQAGALPATAWQDYRDGYLAPAIGGWRLQPSRTRTYRGRKAVEAHLMHAQ